MVGCQYSDNLGIHPLVCWYFLGCDADWNGVAMA